jgi:hypothetical protein
MSNAYGLNPLYPKPAISGTTGNPIAGQRKTVSSAAVQFATAFDANTSLVSVDVQVDDVYVTFDGTTPSSSNGHRLYARDKVLWSKATATAAKFIRVTTDATLQASEFQV